MSVLLYTVLTLCALGVVLAAVLYLVAKRFHVEEDPRIDHVEEMLPGANCGACGYPGCRGMAEALVKQDDISMLYCPVGGAETMSAVAGFLGKAAPEREPELAVVRCAGSTCAKNCVMNVAMPEVADTAAAENSAGEGAAPLRAKHNSWDGARSCVIEAATYAGETGCSWGCLGGGDCVEACAFDAIHMNPETDLPEVVDDKCTACGKCVAACPKKIIELRRRGPKGRRVQVLCVNKDKGAQTRKACSVGCIGCGKCVKVCAFEAITLDSNLAYIDPAKCKLCRKCVSECPTGSIIELGFPPKKPAQNDVQEGAK